MQIFSSLLLTDADSCIILALSSHEIARIYTMPNAYPTEQARKAARARLIAQGLSSKEWAELHGFKPSTVYAVLNGQQKCLRGDAHRAAVLLGIKRGTVKPYPAALAEG
tara:strand:- start:1878 stop:2204 length:327 start_codon:yes stop_codon:yes gene_type:complete